MLIFLTILVLVIALVNRPAEKRSIEGPNASAVPDAAESGEATESADVYAHNKENLSSVEAFVNEVLGPFTVDLETLIDCSITTVDRYQIDADVIISPANAAEVKKAIEYIENYISTSKPSFSLDWRIMFKKDENAGLCLAAFGPGFSANYSFACGGVSSDFNTLEEMPDDLF